MGSNSIEPFVAAEPAVEAGELVLVRTSNEGARDIQDLRLEDGSAVWESVAKLVTELGAPGVGAAGLSDVGAVIGVTEPRHLERARALIPTSPFLLPRLGAPAGRV